MWRFFFSSYSLQFGLDTIAKQERELHSSNESLYSTTVFLSSWLLFVLRIRRDGCFYYKDFFFSFSFSSIKACLMSWKLKLYFFFHSSIVHCLHSFLYLMETIFKHFAAFYIFFQASCLTIMSVAAQVETLSPALADIPTIAKNIIQNEKYRNRTLCVHVAAI